MNIETEHFLILVGQVCDQARMAKLAVEVRTREGRSYTGVPAPRRARPGDPREVDDTGFTNELEVDGEMVRLDEVLEICLRMPDRRSQAAAGRPLACPPK